MDDEIEMRKKELYESIEKCTDYYILDFVIRMLNDLMLVSNNDTEKAAC